MADRVHKSIMNAKVGFIFYFLSIFLAFFSRRIFLDCLGDDFIGLTGTLVSILSFLNVSEVGIGTCIGYFLYKPLESNDRPKINEIVSLVGYLYRIVGTVVLVGGIAVSLSFPFVFANSGIPLLLIYFAFFSFLGSNIIAYYINYRQILLDSDQKTYKISIWTQSGMTAKTLTQILLAYLYRNLYVWVLVELLFSFFVCWVLNRVIDHEYPWLQTDKSRGRDILRKYPEILQKAKQVIIHRLKNFFLSKSDEILIFAFESLRMVTYYGNYNMIVGKLTALFTNVLTGITASVGNLVAEGDAANIRKVFWELTTLRYWVTGVLTILLVFLINPIIEWWLGTQYILPAHIVFLILLNMYIMFTRPSIDQFITAYGLYDDLWAAYAEGIINLLITLIVGYYYGLVGILLGKVVSMLLLVVLWKPYYLYTRGFHTSVSHYWAGVLRHLAILLTCLGANYAFSHATGWVAQPTLWGIFRYGLTISLPVLVLYSALVYLFTPGARDVVARLPLHKVLRRR